MSDDSDPAELEQDATHWHLIEHDDETAGDRWEQAGKARENLGDEAAHSAEYWENPVPPAIPNPGLVRKNHCEAARQYVQAANDLLAAAEMLEAQGKAAAATKLSDEALAIITKAVAWFEICLDSDFEEGRLTRRLPGEYRRLADFFDLLKRRKDAERARRKAGQVTELRSKAAAEAQQMLKEEPH